MLEGAQMGLLKMSLSLLDSFGALLLNDAARLLLGALLGRIIWGFN